VDLRRLRAGEWLAAAGGVALLGALLLPWYDVGGVDPGHSPAFPDATAFEAFSIIDILLTLLALLALALAIFQATQDSPAQPVGAGVLSVTLGLIGIVLVLFRIVDKPDTEFVEVRAGAWIGLAAVLALTAGACLSLANERVRGLPPDLEPELRPTPAP
jgi:hypothetical protein